MANKERKIHCESCKLECEYINWVRGGKKSNSKFTPFIIYSKRNPKCPNDDIKYIELMKKCKHRKAYDSKRGICKVCKRRAKIISDFDYLAKAPEKCPKKEEFRILMEAMSSRMNLLFLNLRRATLPLQIFSQRLSATFKIMRKAGKKLQKKISEKEFQKFHAKYGWITFVSIPTFFDDWYTKFKKGDTSFFDELCDITKGKGGIKELKQKLLESKILSRRIKIFEDILTAHKDERYNLSIPALFAQIEGILWDTAILKGVVENKENSQIILKKGKPVKYTDKKGKTRFKRASMDFLASNIFEKEIKELPNAWYKHLRNSLYTKDRRHGILHGRLLDYGEDKNLSSILLITLYSLTNKVKKIELESKIKPYWEGNTK